MPDGKVTIKVGIDDKEVKPKLKGVEDQIDQTAEAGSEAGELSMRDAAALGLALGGITKALVAAGLQAYEFSSQFGAAFAKTQTIMDQNVITAEDMRSDILKLSKDSAMVATDVSEAVYQAISGSVDTADAVAIVDKANKLAVAGFTALNNATDVLTTTLNAYHLSAEKVDGISNVLIRTQNLGKTSVDELSASMGKAIATGSAYDVNLQNLSTAYVELTRSGINTAESTTYINSMINELGDSGKTVGKILKEQTGKSFGELMKEGKSLGDVLGILMDSVNGNTEALMGLWGSQEAGKAANAIVSQSIEDFNHVLEQMNSEMAGTTGTTEKAYETMTSTSEFIDRRLNNSVKNLAIAYGDILAPPMDAIKSLGADILEGITDLIQKSPVVASAIAAVSTGVVVLAGGIAAYVVITKAAEIAQAALNTTMMMNPYLLAAAAIAALVVGIVSFVSATKESNEQLDAFNEKLKDIDGSFQSELAAVEVASEKADGYIDRLEELEAQGLETAEQQEEYHRILEELVETVPELSGLIDLETDTIEGGTRALRDNTEEWKKNAKEQAYQKHLADLTEAHTQALIEQKKAEIKLREQQEKKNALNEEAYSIQTKINAMYRQAEIHANYSDLNDEFEYLNSLVDENDNGLYEFTMRLREIQDEELPGVEEAIASCNKEFANTKEVVAASEEPLNLAKQAINELIESENEAAASASDTGDKIEEAGNKIEYAGRKITTYNEKAAERTSKTTEITDAIQSWADKYGELYKAAKSSLEKQFKLWEQVEQVTGVSVKEANKGIQSQIDYWNDYNDNLQTIKDSGIEGIEQLYQFISDGSTDSVAMAAGIADAIREGNQPAVENMISLYEDLAAAQGETADSMLSMQTDMDKALDELVSSVDTAVGDMKMSDAAWSAAHETVLAYARGLYQGTASAEEAARSVANATARALRHGGKSGGTVYSGVDNYYASGTDYAAAGLALVGEEGPELIYLRGGERILDAGETRDALRGLYDVPGTVSYSGPAAPASVGGGPAGAQEMTIIVPVEVDGRELARVTAQTMGEEMMFSAY